MNQKVSKSLVAGILGTIVMTIAMMILPYLGFPESDPASMLADMFGVSTIVGWILHFVVGIVFALFYTMLCLMKKFVSNENLRGVLFGIIVFVLAQIGFVILSNFVTMPEPSGDLTMMMIGSVIAHIVYGYTVVKTVGDSYK